MPCGPPRDNSKKRSALTARAVAAGRDGRSDLSFGVTKL
jgi:hypothetical protein